VDSNKTVDAAVTVGSSTWKGTSRGYFYTQANGTFDFAGIRFASGHRPPMVLNSQVGFFFACAGADVGSGTKLIWDDSAVSSLDIKRDGSNKLALSVGGSAYGSATTSMPSDGTTKFSAAVNFDNSTGSAFFYGLESGSLATDGTSATGAGFGGAGGTLVSVGGAASLGNQPAKYHIAATFSRSLTTVEMQSLHNDWFGTLFNAPAAGGFFRSGGTLSGLGTSGPFFQNPLQ
jgi:hypothetical protein